VKVGILGSGEVARALGAGFLKHGHDVMVGTRDPSKLEAWAGDHQGVAVASVAATAAYGEMLVLAVKGSVAADVLAAAGAGNLAGKTVIDATNPISDAPAVNGVISFFTSLDDSLMERLQAAFPDAHLVKAFNSVGNQHMVDPEFDDGPPTMFICGDHDDAKREAAAILEQFGWDVADMGAVEAARAIEPLCILWVVRGVMDGDWGHTFKLLR
jgi:8-hydroxy-5-deazaflavin:NADPH oxidoreductase